MQRFRRFVKENGRAFSFHVGGISESRPLTATKRKEPAHDSWGIVGGTYGIRTHTPVSFIYLKGRTATGNPAGSSIGMLTPQSDRFSGGGIHHPFVTAGQAYAVGLSGEINEHEFGGDTLGLAFTNIVDESNADITAVANSQRTQNEVLQFPEGLYNLDLHFNINAQGAQESRTLEVQLREMMQNTDDVIVDFASGQGGSGTNTGHVTIDFRWDFWRPDPDAKYYFAIVAENEAYNQADWRTRTLTGFLQIVTVA